MGFGESRARGLGKFSNWSAEKRRAEVWREKHNRGVVQIGGRSGIRGWETASGSLLMEIGSAEGAKFPEGIEGRPDNAGKVVPVVASRRWIVRQQAQ